MKITHTNIHSSGRSYMKTEGAPINMGEFVQLPCGRVLETDAEPSESVYGSRIIRAWSLKVPEGFLALAEVLESEHGRIQ